MRAIATPCPEVAVGPSHVVGVDIYCYLIWREAAHIVCACLHTRHLATYKHTSLKGDVARRNLHLAAISHLSARRSRLRAIESVHDACVGSSRYGTQLNLRLVVVDARRQRRPYCLHCLEEEVAPVVALGSKRITSRCGILVGVGAYRCTQSAIGAIGREGIDTSLDGLSRQRALVVDANAVAQQYHLLNVVLAVDPVLVEHARRTRCGKQISVGGYCVLAYRVLLLGSRAYLGVVILYKGNGITLVRVVGSQAAIRQLGPVATISGIANAVAQGEVERSRLYLAVQLCAINPVRKQRLVAVPILAHRELGLCIGIVHAGEAGSVALGHIIAEACITEVFEQHLEVSLYTLLHIGRVVVEVAHSAPALTCIVVLAKTDALTRCLDCRLATVVVGTHVGGVHLIGRALVGFNGEVEPIFQGSAVVDYHIGYGAYALLLEGLYHRAQLSLRAERRIVIAKPIEWIIAH